MLQGSEKNNRFFNAYRTVLALSFFVIFGYAIWSQYVPQPVHAAQSPAIITYQGKVLVNNLSASSSLDMIFALYTASSGGSVVYTASGTTGTPAALSVTPSNGIFTVNLGDTGTNSIDPTIFQNNGTLFLQVTIGVQALSPRKQITAAPYAFNAKYLDGIAATSTASSSAYIPVSDATGNFNFNHVSSTGVSASGLLSVMGQSTLATTTISYLGIGTTTPNNLIQVANLINFDNTGFTTKLGYQAGLNIVLGAAYNTFVGYQAGLSSASLSTEAANSNTGVGYQALYSNTMGWNNTANGLSTLYSNTTGNSNTANGVGALYSNTTGNSNTANGSSALYFNTDGSNNTANGVEALYSNTTGVDNTANGLSALYFNTTGLLNTANGSGALYSNDIGSRNTANGYNALFTNTAGDGNTASGYQAGGYVTGGVGTNRTSTDSVYLGSETRALASGGTNEIVIGASATGVGSNSVVLGNDSVTKTILKGNVGIGTTTPSQKLDVVGSINIDVASNYMQGGKNILYASSTLFNFFGGEDAGRLLKTATANGNYNTALGYQALYAATSTQYNVAVGTQALFNNTSGNSNTANGYAALLSNTAGSSNTANGMQALYANTVGSYNTANGSSALYFNDGSSNTANGYFALYSNTAGSGNTAFGSAALHSNTIGSNNTAIGIWAGRFIANGGNNQTSNNSIFVGNDSRALADGDTNEIVIGDSAIGVGSNSVVLGNDSITKTILKGNVGIGTTTPTANFEVAGNNTSLGSGSSGVSEAWATSTNALPATRNSHSSVVANGYVYVLGGGNADTVYYAKLNADGTVGTWATSTNALPAGRISHSSVVANGYVYVLGGYLFGVTQSTVYYAKLNADGSVGTWTTNANALPEAQRGHSSVVANGYVYVLGGISTSTVYYAKLNADGSVGTWTTNANALPATRSGHSSVVANGYVYVLGGSDTNTVYYAKLNADGSVGTWATATNELPAVRNAHSSIVANGYMYVLGGYGGSSDIQSTVYYAKLNADGSVGTWATATNELPAVRNAHSSIVANGYMYVLGGYGIGWSSQSTVYYASLARTKIFGNLDLLGFSSSTLSGAADGGGSTMGGSIYAGNIFSNGSLEVIGQTNMWGGASVYGALNIKAASSSPTYSMFNVGATSSLFTILSNGNVGIGTSTPLAALHVYSSSSVGVAIFDKVGQDGTIISLRRDNVEQGTISVNASGTVSYNAFTGSHYAALPAGVSDMQQGMLVTFTDANQRFHDDQNSEIIYGVTSTARANDSKVLGSYLSLQTPGSYSKDNPYLVMAVGNGVMWVADNGQNIDSGDYLISSNVAGHAMKDIGEFDLSYVIGRAGESVDWSVVTSTIDGVKHAKVSVLYENFVKDNRLTKTFTIDTASTTVSIGTASTSFSLKLTKSLSFTDPALNTVSFAGVSAFTSAVSDGVTDRAFVFNASNFAQSPNSSVVTFQAQGVPVLSIKSNGDLSTNGIIQANQFITGTSTLDLAETYPVDQNCNASGNCPEAGDTVCLVDGQIATIEKCALPYSEKAIGIVSTKPGFTLGDASDSLQRKIALAGRVPVKVSVKNGSIKVGDRLTTSDIPGVAMKAADNGPTVGVALADYYGSDDGTVLAFVKMGWWSPLNITSPIVQNGEGLTLVNLAGAIFDVLRNVGVMIENGVVKATQFIADKVTSREIETQKLCVEGVCVTKDQFKDLLDRNNIVPSTSNDSAPTVISADPVTTSTISATSTDTVTSTPVITTSTESVVLPETTTPSSTPVAPLVESSVLVSSTEPEPIPTLTPDPSPVLDPVVISDPVTSPDPVAIPDSTPIVVETSAPLSDSLPVTSPPPTDTTPAV